MSRSNLAAASQDHIIIIQPLRGVVGVQVPALYLSVNGSPHLVHSLISHFLHFPDKSISWMRMRARALGLFFDYCSAVNRSGSYPASYRDMLSRFGIALANGTINPKSAADDLGLYWPPSSIENAKKITGALQSFIEWCSYRSLIPEYIKIRKDQMPTDEHSYLKYLHQAYIAKSFMFLSHTVKSSDIAKKIDREKKAKFISFGTNTATTRIAKTFPDEYVSKLITHGFVRNPDSVIPWDREDITAKMITLLLLFGGTRHSEPYHIWYNDVIPQVDGSCKVFLRHPSESETFLPGEKGKSRKQYLAEGGLFPRNNNSCSQSYKAGWKNLAIDEDYQAAILFSHPAAESMFRELYLIYITRYRPLVMAQRKSVGGLNHPFLFVSRWSGDIGSPSSINSYLSALERAYKRLNHLFGYGIVMNKRGGTTPHGMRHYYAQALRALGMDQMVIKKCLRHRTLEAQSIYTEPGSDEIRKSLDAAMRKIANGALGAISLNTISALEGGV